MHTHARRQARTHAHRGAGPYISMYKHVSTHARMYFTVWQMSDQHLLTDRLVKEIVDEGWLRSRLAYNISSKKIVPFVGVNKCSRQSGLICGKTPQLKQTVIKHRLNALRQRGHVTGGLIKNPRHPPCTGQTPDRSRHLKRETSSRREKEGKKRKERKKEKRTHLIT